MQNFLENGLKSRLMAKKFRLTENTKQRRVEIAEENVELANRIWRTIFLHEFSFENGSKGQFRLRTVGTGEDLKKYFNDSELRMQFSYMLYLFLPGRNRTSCSLGC